MLIASLATLSLLSATALQTVAQTTAPACNNSPTLCSRAYNNVTYLGAHDSPFVRDGTSVFTLAGDQNYNSTVQLSAGVRLLTAQVHRTNTTSTGELHLCHTSCALADAGRLSDWLREIGAWLAANGDDVVTVILVNADHASASELAAEYEAAGVVQYAYVPSPELPEAWPTLTALINNGTRMLNFVASVTVDPTVPYIMQEFTYIFETDYQTTDPADFSCVANRPPTVANDTAAALADGLMPLMNHFLYAQQTPDIMTPNESYVATTNAPSGGLGNLGDAASGCVQAYRKPPNFLLVDFFDVGPAIDTIDRLNGVTNPVGRVSVSAAPTASSVTASHASSTGSQPSSTASGQAAQSTSSMPSSASQTQSSTQASSQPSSQASGATSSALAIAMLCLTLLVALSFTV